MRPRSLALLLPLACLLAVASCSESTDPESGAAAGTVSGTVTIYDDPGSLDGILVVLMDDEYVISRVARLSAGDRFTFENVPAGPARVHILHEHYVLAEPSLSVVQVRAGATIDLPLRLLRNANMGYDYRISGRVTDAATGAPVAGAWIAPIGLGEVGNSLRYLLESSSTPVTASDAEGRFSLAVYGVQENGMGPVIGLTPISCGRQGYHSRTFAGDGPDAAYEDYLPGGLLPAPADSNLVLDIALAPVPADGPAGSGAVTGVIRHDGAPAAGVGVTATLMSLAERDTVLAGATKVAVHDGTVYTAADGSFRMDLQPGFYALRAGLLPDDGWVSTGLLAFEIVAGETFDAGAFNLRPAVRPLTPAPRDTVDGVAPVFAWTAVPGADAYRVVVSIDGYEAGNRITAGRTTDTQLTWPYELPPPGAHHFVRWNVYAENDLEPGLVWTISSCETPATFTWLGPAE